VSPATGSRNLASPLSPATNGVAVRADGRVLTSVL